MVQSNLTSVNFFLFILTTVKMYLVQCLKPLFLIFLREEKSQHTNGINTFFQSFAWLVPGYLVGGEKRKSEKARIRRGITILVGTPGRLLDHANSTETLSFHNLTYLVLDEADRLLDFGYEKDVSK